jgi:anti-sigma28 factor (negative regulator of flagellin synthesis)
LIDDIFILEDITNQLIKGAVMARTKSQIWNRVEEIIEDYSLNKEVAEKLANLLEPRTKSSNRIIKTIDGTVYKNCRFTGRLWPADELIYQNDQMRAEDKDKGYSKVGISIWSKGQKHIKELKNDLTTEILSDTPDSAKVEELKTELKEIETGNLGNDYNWLLQFMTEEQETEYNSVSLPIE